MNKLTSIALGLLCVSLPVFAVNPLDGPLVTLKATVSDDAGEPIENATVKGLFRTTRGSGEKVKEALTDGFGRASVSAETPFSAYLYVNKDGYYQSHFDRIDTSERNLAELAPRSRSRHVTLREVLNPVPLIAKRWENVQIPAKDEWVGYDLELGEWVEPHGKGERRDVLFRYSNKFLGYKMDEPKLSEVVKVAKRLAENRGEEWTEEKQKSIYGNWSGKLEISFPGEKEGILTMNESNGYVAESAMRIPHQAPEDGYEESITWSDVRNAKIMARNGDGYFLRVRVKERNDQILEANYAKIHEEVDFDPRGKVTLSYCFNPDVNDRNLEFDTDKNLLSINHISERVRLP